MRAWCVVWFLTGTGTWVAPAHAQQAMPVGITRGRLLSSEGGLLEIRRADGAIYDCSYDAHTLFQRNRWPIQAGDLNRGEPVEVLSDRRPGTRVCYTRMLSVVHEPQDALIQSARESEMSVETPSLAARPDLIMKRPSFVPRAYLSFAGVVIRSDAGSFTLRGRGGERTILLRADTRFSEGGVRLDAPAALVNKHVFVRGGRNLYGGVEAYQVMWGEIFMVP